MEEGKDVKGGKVSQAKLIISEIRGSELLSKVHGLEVQGKACFLFQGIYSKSLIFNIQPVRRLSPLISWAILSRGFRAVLNPCSFHNPSRGFGTLCESVGWPMTVECLSFTSFSVAFS